MTVRILLGASVVGIAAALAAGGAQAQGASISISCGAVGQELELCREGAQAWAEATGNTVTVVSTEAAVENLESSLERLSRRGW
ncbi:hypothetical protein [Salinarimonas ramus]|uniref:C4-dicarboxylate ABC transporter substrate-binding protein n=1 Tax=Salinarimonas ramus TaxID=690164 RepID=A0A917QK88_9HYPH|nr:hypothetical protein [Salinarimonas ramus]GGK54603.1 hypothetical protein GCM10011322_46720 [Salinarimonas ramus]